MNALDPLLVETVLRPVESQRWLPLLREHYRQVKLCYPGEFADVEESWRHQRLWWMQFTESAEQSSGSSGRGSVDVTEPEPVEPPARRQERGSFASAPPAPVRASVPAAQPLGGVAPAPAAGQPAPQLPLAGPEDPDPPVQDKTPPPSRPSPPAKPLPRSATVRPPAAAQSGSRSLPAKRSMPASRPVRTAKPVVSASAPRSFSPPGTPVAPAGRAASVAWTGKVALGARGRRLVEAARQSYAAVRAQEAQWVRQSAPAPVSDWHSWSIPSTVFADAPPSPGSRPARPLDFLLVWYLQAPTKRRPDARKKEADSPSPPVPVPPVPGLDDSSGPAGPHVPSGPRRAQAAPDDDRSGRSRSGRPDAPCSPQPAERRSEADPVVHRCGRWCFHSGQHGPGLLSSVPS